MCIFVFIQSKGLASFTDAIITQACFWSLFTSQCCWQQEVGSILPDEIVSDGLGGGSAAKETDVPDELGGQGQRRLQEISPLHGQVVHLPSPKLSGQNQKSKVNVSLAFTLNAGSCWKFRHIADTFYRHIFTHCSTFSFEWLTKEVECHFFYCGLIMPGPWNTMEQPGLQVKGSTQNDKENTIKQTVRSKRKATFLTFLEGRQKLHKAHRPPGPFILAVAEIFLQTERRALWCRISPCQRIAL